MFFFFKKEVLSTIKIRDEWGELHDVEVGMTQKPHLSDQELADQLETNVATVITHRRD